MTEKCFEEQSVQSRDGTVLNIHVFDTERPKAVVRCIHGMEEHQGRYIPFAVFLRDHGYAVITADLRGHGEKAARLSHIADRDGERLLIEDEDALLKQAKARYPEVPVYLFGHSMGSIIARKLLQTHSRDFTKAALSGYPNPQAAASAGAALTRCIAAFKGWGGYSKLVDNLAFGGFTKAVKNAETPLDWLSVNRENVRRYQEDPLCGVPFTLGSYEALFRMLIDINKPELYRDVQTELPILLISGEDDPCTGGEKGRADSLDRLTRAGFRDLRVETLPGMRHEILNETENEIVYQKILDFFEE